MCSFRRLFILTVLSLTIFSVNTSRALAFTNSTIGLGASIRTEAAADGINYNTFQNPSLFYHLPVLDERWIYQLEYHFLKKETSEGILEVNYKRHELQNWGLWKLNPNGKTLWLAGLGLSVSQEQVTSKLLGSKTSRDTGDPYLSTGLQLAIVRNFFEVIMAQVSLQILYPFAREERESEGLITFRIGYNF